jgi:uncharacterized membrane protein YphA (DoxX/SURF4 family)
MQSVCAEASSDRIILTETLLPAAEEDVMAGTPVSVSYAAARWLTRYSIDVLRICVGVVFLVFGALKLQPGASPVEHLVIRTVHALTLGIVSGHAALLLAAEMEIFIGVTLISGRALKTGLAVLAVALVGILSPLVLFPSELFHGGVTLEAQYVFKDIVLAAAGLVLAAQALGARLTIEIDERRGARQDALPDGNTAVSHTYP